jgi:hypothetical protein
MGHGASLEDLKRKFLILPELEARPLNRPSVASRYAVFYQLQHNPAFLVFEIPVIINTGL